MRSLMLTAAVAALLAACGGTEGRAQAPAAAPKSATGSLETRPANAPEQNPAFAGQTRAPEMKANVAYQVQTVADGLVKPWGLAFLPDGALLITERPGRLRLLPPGGKLSEPLAGLPEVDARGQGGLLGLAVDPKFKANGLVYWSFAEANPAGGNHTAVARGKLVTTGGAPRIEGAKVIWRQSPSLESTLHYGGRLVFARDGTLFVTLGERSILPGRAQAQRTDGTLGKIVRINADGTIPRNNPFVGKAGYKPEIYAIGVRNVQSAVLDPATGKLWEIEHGTKGGDELNIIEPGRNYGWPTIAYGVEYAGGPIGEGLTAKPGLEQPAYYWDPVIAPSGMAIYQANLFPAWKGSVFVGAMKDKNLARLTVKGGRVVGEERILGEVNERLRDVVVGPDGALYLATDNENGRVLKVTPKG